MSKPWTYLLTFFILFACEGEGPLLAQSRVDSITNAKSVDLGIIPESFDMAIDSLFNSRYRNYFSAGKKRKRPLTSAEANSYRDRILSMNSVIPLTYNSIVQECIDMYVNRGSPLLSLMLAKSAYYFPIIEEQFDKLGIPLELKYLAIVESALNPTAVSRMGATGLWQFMLRTAKIYGLQIDSLVDERRDPVKSTQAAGRYFKDMYSIYQDWLLVIAAYNCGPGNVNKAIRKADGSTDFWKIFPYLPRETRSYVPFFIAAFYSIEYHKYHRIRPDLVRIPLSTDTVHLHSRFTFSDLSYWSGVNIDTIRLLNPQYRRDIVPSGSQILVLPSSKAANFSAIKDSIHQSCKDIAGYIQPVTIVHIVRHKETLSSIADRYGVSIDEIKDTNRLKKNTLRKGQKLYILVTTEMLKDSDRSSSDKPDTRISKGKYHIVKRGETLSSIARMYRGTSPSSIKKANNLSTSHLKPGQRIRIP